MDSLTCSFMCIYMFKHMSITAGYTYTYNSHIVHVHTLTHRHARFKAVADLVFWDHVVPSSRDWYLTCKTKTRGTTKTKPRVL